MMPVFYRVAVLRAGAQTSTKSCPTREGAEAEFANAVRRATRLAIVRRVPYRVELWRGETLLEHADAPAGVIVPQPRA